MVFKKSVKRAERSNLIDNYVNGTIGEDMSVEMYEDMFDGEPAKLLDLVGGCFGWVVIYHL